jgi:hypothetical protein
MKDSVDILFMNDESIIVLSALDVEYGTVRPNIQLENYLVKPNCDR